MQSLNKAKKKDTEPFWSKVLGWTLGIGVVGFLFLLFFIPFTAYAVFAHGFVLSKLWAWFIVPFGVAPLQWLHAAGIIVAIRLCTYNPEHSKEEEGTTTGERVAKLIGLACVPWLSLLIGWLIHICM